MNILFITQRLTGGGAERVCVSVANGLSLLGHNIIVLISSVSEKDYPIDPDIEIVHTSGNNILQRRYDYLSKIAYIVKRKQINVVVNVLNNFPLETALLCRLLGVKSVFSDHNSYERPTEASFTFRQKLVKFYINRLYNYTTVLTNRDKVVLAERNDVVVMPNPLFLEPNEKIPEKQRTILAVGRLDVWYTKGFDILIKAWSKICHKYPEWTLRIVGSGSECDKTRLEGFVSESRACRVVFAPFRKDIVEEYKHAEVFVLSSRFEGFGLVLIEAMSQRCACISCDYLSRQKDIVTDGVDALLCDVNDIDALALKIDYLLQNDEIRHSLQKHSIDNLERYSELKIAKMWESFLQLVISK